MEVASACDSNVNTKSGVYAIIFPGFMMRTNTDIYTDQPLKMQLSDSGDPKTCKIIEISISKNKPQNNTFSTIHG